MEIIFYKSKQEQNLFPKTLTEGYSVSGTLRSECDILNPIITFVGNNFLLDYNYAYISDFKRYYFITDITSVRDGVVEIAFHVDVLNSWSNEILQHEALIERCEDTSKADFRIYDDNIIVYPELKELATFTFPDTFVNPFRSNQGQYIVITHVYGAGGNEVSNYQSPINRCENSFSYGESCTTFVYVLNFAQFYRLNQTLMKEDLLANLFYDVNRNYSYLLRAYYIPFRITNSSFEILDENKGFRVGGNTEAYDNQYIYPVIRFYNTSNSDSELAVMDFPLNSIDDVTNDLKENLSYDDDFRNYNNITKWSLNIPMFGVREINPLLYKKYYDTLRLRYYFNVFNGDICVKLCAVKNGMEHLITNEIVNVSTDIPLFTGNTEMWNKFLFDGLKSAFSIGTSSLTGYYSSTISNRNFTDVTKKLNTKTNRMRTSKKRSLNDERTSETYSERSPIINDIYPNNMPQPLFTKLTEYNTSNVSTYNTNPFFKTYQYYNRFPDDYNKYIGYICNNTYTINNCNGFIKVNNIHLEIPCLSEEISEIENLLYSGVIIRGHIANEVTE